MKKIIPLVLLLLLGIAVIAQDTIHVIPEQQKDNILSIFTYLATLLAGWFIGIFGKSKQKDR